MVSVALKRRTSPADRAKQWLEWLAETPRHILMAAVMADIADETSALTRFMDDEGMDVAGISAAIGSFLARCNELFGTAEKCLTTVGYTKTILDDLQECCVIVNRVSPRSAHLRIVSSRWRDLAAIFANQNLWGDALVVSRTGPLDLGGR